MLMIEVNAVHICRVPGIMELLLFSKAQHDLVSPQARDTNAPVPSISLRMPIETGIALFVKNDTEKEASATHIQIM